MNTTSFDVPASIACPHCARPFPFMLRLGFVPAGRGNRIHIEPDADRVCFEMAGHVIGEHPNGLDAAALASWVQEQSWAAAHAASFALGEALRAQGYRLSDDGEWAMPA